MKTIIFWVLLFPCIVFADDKFISLDEPIFTYTPAYKILFYGPDGKTGTLDFSGDKAVYTGNLEPDEAAMVFFDTICGLIDDHCKDVCSKKDNQKTQRTEKRR